jgi:hypothetical protein
MTDPDVAREARDILQKQLCDVLGDGLFARFGLDLPRIVGSLPADLPVIEVRAQYLDRLFDLEDDSLADVELQSTYVYEDLLRFGDYSWAAFRKHRKRVRTIVLYGPAVTTEPPRVVEAGGHTFRLTNILLSRQDGDAALARLLGKTARGAPLDALDRVDLALIALLPHSPPLADVADAVLPVVRTLTRMEQIEAIGTIIGLGYHYLEASLATVLLERFKMANALEELIAEGILQGREEGLEKGRAEGLLDGERGALRLLLERRFGQVPHLVAQTIANADKSALDAMFERAITAPSTDDL